MRRPGRTAAAVAALLCISMVGAACGSDDGDKDSSTATTSAAVPKGGTLVIGAEQEPDCMDWISTCSGSTWGDYMVKEQTMPAPFVFEKEAGNTLAMLRAMYHGGLGQNVEALFDDLRRHPPG